MDQLPQNLSALNTGNPHPDTGAAVSSLFEIGETAGGGKCVITPDEKNYREAVEILMRLQSGKAISNGLPAHAAILYESFFRNAQEHIRIFCKNLSNEVFGLTHVVEAAAAALEKKNVKMDILIQDSNPDCGLFGKFLLANSDNPRLQLRRVDDANIRGAIVNFSVMDEQAIRFEKDRNEIKAFAIMFAPALAQTLIDKFDIWFKGASPLKLTPSCGGGSGI